MAVSVADFKEAFPEFKAVGQERVRAALDGAEADTSSEVFGSRFKRAVMLLAAHELQEEATTYTSVTYNPDPRAKLGGASSAGKAPSPTRRSRYLAERERIEGLHVVPVLVV